MAKARTQLFQYVMDAGSVILDLIRDRHNTFGLFKAASIFQFDKNFVNKDAKGLFGYLAGRALKVPLVDLKNLK